MASDQKFHSGVGDVLVSREEVLRLVKVDYSTLWRWMVAGKFPLARQCGGQKIQWLRSDIEKWIAGLPVHKVKKSA